MSKILLKNCYYILQSCHEEGLRGYDLLIEDNRVAKIAKKIDFSSSLSLSPSLSVTFE